MSSLKASSGQAITADLWNRVTDRLPTGTAGFGVGGAGPSQTTIRVKNISGSDRDIGEVMAIDSYAGPTATYDAAKGPHFEVDEIDWHDTINDVAVLSEPVPDGEFGSAVISGLSLLKMSGSGDYAMIDPSATTECKGATGGFARVLGTVGSGFVMADLSSQQRFWHYELTEDWNPSGTTSAKLLTLTDAEYSSSIELTDLRGFVDDQLSGDVGMCIQSGNLFIPIQAVC